MLQTPAHVKRERLSYRPIVESPSPNIDKHDGKRWDLLIRTQRRQCKINAAPTAQLQFESSIRFPSVRIICCCHRDGKQYCLRTLFSDSTYLSTRCYCIGRPKLLHPVPRGSLWVHNLPCARNIRDFLSGDSKALVISCVFMGTAVAPAADSVPGFCFHASNYTPVLAI